MIIPEWISPYLSIVDDDFLMKIKYSDRSFFADRMENLRNRCKTFTPRGLSLEARKTLVREYILCILALAMIDQSKAELQVAEGLPANDGRNRQHWIPECYLKEFAENKKLIKVGVGYFSSPEIRLELVAPVGLKHPDFCEPKAEKGLLYSPLFEIILSKIETHYAELDKSRIANNYWEVLVLTVFFLIFQIRTKQQFIANHPAWEVKESLLMDVIPSFASELEPIFYPLNLFPDINTNIKMPISQHPLFLERESEQAFSLWCIYTANSLIELRHKDRKDVFNGKNGDYIINRLRHLIGNNDLNPLYFSPSSPLWSPATILEK